MAGRIKDEDVTYIRDHSPIDDVVGEYVQLKNAYRRNPSTYLGEVELRQQGLALTIAEAAQTARRGNLQLGHDLLRLDLAHLGQGFQQSGNLHLAEDLIGLGILEHLLQVGATALESFLELSSDTTCGSGLFQRGGALLRGQLGKGHGFLRLITIIVLPGQSSLASADDRTQALRRNLTRPPRPRRKPAG